MRIWPWTPHENLFEHGVLDARLLWAALDCPGGLAGLLAGDDLPPAVLRVFASKGIEVRPLSDVLGP